ncbi:hypothetical protein YT14_002787 [Salmonella enterica subsp. enterica serovar Oslo]|nr:hypothetical protein [Salmonella enterica subsp. enterica serovar Oslo]
MLLITTYDLMIYKPYLLNMDIIMIWNYDVRWRVIQSVCIGEGDFILILESPMFKIMARVLTTHPINPADVLSPTKSGYYTLNGINTQRVKFTSSTKLNTSEWRALVL